VAAAGFRSQREYFTEQLLRLSKSSLEELQRQAVFSLGEAPWQENDGEVPPQVVNQLEALAAGTESDGLLAASVSVVLALVPKDQASSDRFLEIVRAALAKEEQRTLGAVAQAYAFKRDSLAPAFLMLLTNYLKANVTQNAQVLQWVDFGVSSRLSTTDRNEAFEILEEVLRRFPGSIEIKSFGCCESSISSSLQLRSFIVTRWWASGEAALCDAAGDLLQRFHRDDVIIDEDRDASELTLLHAWQIYRTFAGSKSKASEAGGIAFASLFQAYRQIASSYIGKMVPHLAQQHALSAAVQGSSPGRCQSQDVRSAWEAGDRSSMELFVPSRNN